MNGDEVPSLQELLYTEGTRLASLGRYSESIRILERLLESDTGNILARVSMAGGMNRIGLFRDAISLCEQATELDPGSPDAGFMRAS